MNAKELIRFAFGDAIKDTPAGPVLMSPELADPEPCSCDEALALRAELERAKQIASDTADILGKASAERQEARAEVRALRTDLARTRFLSVVRGRLCDAWAKMLDRTRTELHETQVAYYGCSLHRDELEAKLAEAKRAAETWEELAHGQEALGRQADALVERFKALALDATAKMNAMEVSMNAAYTERNRLVALVARICKPTAGIRRTPIEGWNPEWTNCVFIDTSQGQMSWHYHDSDAHLFADLPAYEKPWDGHTTAEKYERLWRLTELTAAIP